MPGLFAVLFMFVVPGVLLVPGIFRVLVVAMAVLHMELLGAIGPFEFMALAGNGKQGNGH